MDEGQQTSKEQTKISRFMLEGPRPCTINCGRDQKNVQKHTIKNFVEFPLLTMVFSGDIEVSIAVFVLSLIFSHSFSPIKGSLLFIYSLMIHFSCKTLFK